MASRYNFSKQHYNRITNHLEVYQVVEANSFDEARNEVDKGIRDQILAEEAYFKAHFKAHPLPNNAAGLAAGPSAGTLVSNPPPQGAQPTASPQNKK